MKHLSSYNKFLSEKYNFDPTDSLEISTQKKSANKIEQDVKEYAVKKVALDNIYLTYTDEKDLVNKLRSQNLISGNPSNQKTIEFLNPLLNIHAQISKNMRKVKSIEAEIKSEEDNKSTKSDIASETPGAKDAMNNDISAIDDKIASKKSEILKINSDMLTLKKSIDTQLASMKEELMGLQRRISTNQTDKISEK
jgi:hypothetical protein